MAHTKPLEIHGDFYWNEDHALYCEGHVDPLDFIAAVHPSYNLKPSDAPSIRHLWIRKVPDSTGEYSMRWIPCDGPGPGVKAYTIHGTH